MYPKRIVFHVLQIWQIYTVQEEEENPGVCVPVCVCEGGINLYT